MTTLLIKYLFFDNKIKIKTKKLFDKYNNIFIEFENDKNIYLTVGNLNEH